MKVTVWAGRAESAETFAVSVTGEFSVEGLGEDGERHGGKSEQLPPFERLDKQAMFCLPPALGGLLPAGAFQTAQKTTRKNYCSCP